MLDATSAKQFAARWIAAFNSHSVDRVMSLYADDAEVVSPTALRVLSGSNGTVRGRAALTEYFTKALAAYPYLSWQLIEVTYGLSCVVVYFVNEKATRSCEVLELDAEGRVIRHLATYSS